MSWGRDVHVYPVEYIDHRKPPDFALLLYSDLLQYKHKAYTFESEVRFVILNHTEPASLQPDGLRMPAPSLSALLESIEVHPLADDMTIEAVKDVCLRYGLEAPVKRSSLSEVPT